MWLRPALFQCGSTALAVVVGVVVMAVPLSAQEAATAPAQTQTRPAKPPQPYGGGSPLDVLLHTKFWETPPPAQPFVKESRVPMGDLHYQPTGGPDPKPAKLMSSGQLHSLEDELEQAGARNERVAGVHDRNFADVRLAKKTRSKPKWRRQNVRVWSAKGNVPLNLH